MHPSPALTIPRLGRPVSVQKARVKKHRATWSDLANFHSQRLFVEFSRPPGQIQIVEAVSLKPLPRLNEKLEVFGDGDEVLVVVPLLSNHKILKDLTRYVGLQRPLNEGPELFFRPLARGKFRSDVHEAKSWQLPEE